MAAILSSSLWSARAVRWSASLHVAALAVQLAAMLLFLSGMSKALLVHSLNAWIVLALGIVLLLAVLACRPARASGFFTAAALVIVIAEALEIHVAGSGAIFTHVTLAMIVWGLALSLLIRTATAPWQPK